MLKETIFTSIADFDIRIKKIKCTQNERGDLHMHNEFELHTVYDGPIDYIFTDSAIRLMPGDVIFVNSNVPHATASYSNTWTRLVIFSNPNAANSTDDSIVKNLYIFANKKSNNIEYCYFKHGEKLTSEFLECIEEIEKEYHTARTGYKTYIKMYIYKIMAMLYRNKIIPDVADSYDEKKLTKIMPALEYIENHYNETINLKELSKLTNINEYNFCKLFKSIIGTPFLQYLNFVRICKAEDMMINTDKTLTEISYESGFSSTSYFSRIFKKFKYASPSEYRRAKNHLKRRLEDYDN